MTSSVSSTQRLRLYFFASALAANLFLGIIILANSLSIRYFFHTAPSLIQFDFVSPLWLLLLWIGTLYAIYMTREAVRSIGGFRLISSLFDVALIGSFLLIISAFPSAMGTELNMVPPIDQLLSLMAFVGFILCFSGSSLSLLTVLAQSQSVLRLFMIYFISLLVPIEFWSLAHWIAYPFDVVAYLGFAWSGALVELQIFYLTYPLISWLFLALLFSWIWVPLVRHTKTLVRLKEKLRTVVLLRSSQTVIDPYGEAASAKNPDQGALDRGSISRPALVTGFLIFLALGVFVASYPYISQKPGFVGNDSRGYYYELSSIDDQDLYGAARLAVEVNSARASYSMLLYFLRILTQLAPDAIVRLMPVLTIVVNGLAVFWFVKVTEKNALLALMAAVFSVFSLTTTISMHAGTLANWLGIALAFVMFGLVLKLQQRIKLGLFLAAILAVAVVFMIHYWSGLFFTMVLGCYLVLTLWDRGGFSSKLAIAIVPLAFAALIALMLSGFFAGILGRYGIQYSSSDFWNLPVTLGAFWARLPVLIDAWFFGAFANPVLIGLALIGMIVSFCQKTDFSRLLVSWTIVGSLLSVLVSPIGEEMNQWLMWRTLYLIPFQILAAVGLFFLVAKLWSMRENKLSVERSVFSKGVVTGKGLPVILALSVGYAITASLLTFGFPVLPTLFIINYVVLTLLLHFRVQKELGNTVLIFLFAFLVILMMFSYTLRSLAPLALHRLPL